MLTLIIIHLVDPFCIWWIVHICIHCTLLLELWKFYWSCVPKIVFFCCCLLCLMHSLNYFVFIVLVCSFEISTFWQRNVSSPSKCVTKPLDWNALDTTWFKSNLFNFDCKTTLGTTWVRSLVVALSCYHLTYDTIR